MESFTSIQVKPFGFCGDDIIPKISSTGELQFNDEEILYQEYADNVKIMGKTSRGWACDFGMDGIPKDKSWKIYVTTKRIAVISEFIPPLFGGKPVTKKGKVSVGQVKLSNVGKIDIDNSSNNYLLRIYYKRNDGAGLYFIIEGSSDTIESLYERISSISK